MFMKERWVEHPDYPHYQISSFGMVRNLKTGRHIFPQLTHGGVLSVQVVNREGVRRTRQVKRLVLEVYPKLPWTALSNPVIAHYDQDHTNCATDNLYWTSRGNQWALKDTRVQDDLLRPMRLKNLGSGISEKFSSALEAARWRDICPVQTIWFGYGRDIYAGYEYGFL